MEGDALEGLSARLRELEAVLAAGKSLASSLDLGAVLDAVARHFGELLRPRYVAVLLRGADGACAVALATGTGAERLTGLRLEPGEGIAGVAAQAQRLLLVPDVLAHAPAAPRLAQALGQPIRSVLAVPLVARGRTLGVVEILNGPGDQPFGEEQRRLAQDVADFAASAVDHARHYRRVQELTIIDERTGLFNARFLRHLLAAEIERSRRFQRACSVMFFDLDRFKSVNDTHGHAAGNALLEELAQVMVATLRSVDVPVRYGGDEFVVVLPETERAAALEVAARLKEAIGGHEFLGDAGLRVRVTGSFGVATFPQDGARPEELIRAADRAMYDLKSREGNATGAVTPQP